MATKTKDKILQGSTAPSKPADPNRAPMASAANPAPADIDVKDLADSPAARTWGQEPEEQGAPSMSYDQLTNFQRAPIGVPSNAINVAPGSNKVDITDNAKKTGVLAGAPEVVNEVHNYFDIQRRLAQNEEDLKQLEKRRKRNALFSAIGDGVSALANLYFTTKGSPSADQSKTMSKAQQDAYEKDRAFLEGRGARLLELKEKSLAAQRANMYKQEELKLERQIADTNKAIAEAKNEAALKRAEAYMNHLTQRYNLLKEEQEADNKRKDAVAKSTIGKNNAMGTAAKTRAGAYVSGVKNQNYNRDRDTNSKIRNRGKEYDYVTEGEQWTDEDTGKKHTRTIKKKVPRGSRPKKPLGESPQGL